MSRANGHQWALVHSDDNNVWKVKNLTEHFRQHDAMFVALKAAHNLIEDIRIQPQSNSRLLQVQQLINAAWPYSEVEGSS